MTNCTTMPTRMPLESLLLPVPNGPPDLCRGELVQHEVLEAMGESRRWIRRPNTTNPLVQLMKHRNEIEEEGWLRAIKFGPERVGRNNDEKEKSSFTPYTTRSARTLRVARTSYRHYAMPGSTESKVLNHYLTQKRKRVAMNELKPRSKTC